MGGKYIVTTRVDNSLGHVAEKGKREREQGSRESICFVFIY